MENTKNAEKLELTEKTHKNIKFSHLIKPLYFCLFAILLEMINFLWLNFTTSSGVKQILPDYFVLDLAVYAIIAGIMFLCSRKIANVIMYIFISLQTLINIVNATLYKVFGDIFSFDMMKLGDEAVSAFKFEFIDFWSILVNLLILGLLITIQVLVDKKVKKEISLNNLKAKTFRLIACGAALMIGFTSFFTQTLVFKGSETSVRVYASDKYLWDNQHFKLESYKNFGTFGFYFKSLANLIYKDDHLTDEEKLAIKNSIDSGKQNVNQNATLYGDNLIVIMLESFEWFAIDPYNTPTLWDIKTNSGITFENYYSKNKTNVSEDIVLLGNMPKNTGMDYLAEKDLLNTEYTLPNMFKNLGLNYQTNYFHSYKKSFYDRDMVNKSIGFDNVYGIEDAELDNKSTSFNDWNLDSAFIDYMMDEFIPSDTPFMSFFTTVTTHGTYDRVNERFTEYYTTYDNNLENYKNWVEENTNLVYPTTEYHQRILRQYKCAAMDTDKMVQNVIAELERKGIADKTTILLYSDHNCYYEDLYFTIKGTSKDDFQNIYNYNVPCMIYSPKLTPQVKTEFTNTYDLFPTLCSLYGLPYNTTLTQGYNMFSPEIENSTMISYLTGIFDDKFYSLNIVDAFKISTASEQDLETFKANSAKFFEKQYNIELIYKYGLAGQSE